MEPLVIASMMEIAKAINNVALEIAYSRKQMEKLDRTISKLNEVPVDVTVENKEG
jgi:hypothetical protein